MKLILLICAASFSLAPHVAQGAQDDAAATELKDRAQRAYLAGRDAEALALDLQIAQKHPGTAARRYAVQMLGTIYEDNLADVANAIKWDREFLEKYADPRQKPFYEKKIATLEQMARQKDAFATYQRIRFANQGDEAMVKQFEALLKEHPDFLLRDKVQSELGYAYARLDQRQKSYLAFEALSNNGKRPLSSTDRIAYRTATLHWKETAAWGWAAWAVVGVLWALALLGDPWRRLDRKSIGLFLILALAWAALTAVRMPTYHSMETVGYPIIIPDRVVYLGAGLNLTVLAWLLLLSRGQLWRARPTLLRWVSPLLTILMTTAVLYLFVVRQPNGPQIMDVFYEQYQRWAEEWRREHAPAAASLGAPGQHAAEQPVAQGTSASRSAQ